MKEWDGVQAIAAIILVSFLVIGSLVLSFVSRSKPDSQAVPSDRIEEIEKRLDRVEESLRRGRYRMDELEADNREEFDLIKSIKEKIEKSDEGVR